MKNKKYSSAKYYILLLAIIISGVLLLSTLSSPDLLEYWFDFLGSSEIIYLVPVFLIMLISTVFYLIRLVLKQRAKDKKRRKKRKKLNIPEITSSTASTTAVGASAEEKEKDSEEHPSRFYMLTETDRIMRNKPQGGFDEEITMKEFCERFRNFAASRLKLYYDIREIRRFVASLAVSHIIIMQGMSGTGKTSLAYAFGEFLSNHSVIVPIQPMWKERTDLVGYYNEFTKKFNETTLLQKMYEANYSKEIYITVLDEMNIARVEYYFAEFLSLLELPNPEGRYIDVVTDKWDNDPKLLKKGQLKLPENMWFIGTANNDDSTFAISDKVYDRAMIMNLDKKTHVFYAEDTEGVRLTYDRFKKLIAKAKREYGITGRKLRQIKELDRYMIENFHITFGNRIMKQLKEYVSAYIACGGTEEEAVDDIIAKKIMRKLEMQNPVYVRNAIDGLCTHIEETFGQEKMTLTKDYLRHLERTI